MLRKAIRVGMALLGLTAPLSARAEPQKLAPGAGTFELSAVVPDKQAMTVWYYRPAGLRPTDPVLFVMHGVLRNADVYRDAWVQLAQSYRFLLLTPEFSRELFPTTESYNMGNMVAKGGAPIPRERWSFQVIDRVFDEAKARTGLTRERYSIFGHSAGAQFVHRLATFAADARIERAITANAGWYTLPVRSEKFPYGLEGTEITEAELKRNFAKDLIVLLGEADSDPNHENLRRNLDADRQGIHRLERGQNFFKVAQAEAARLGADFKWRLETVPGVGHDNTKMAGAAAKLLFGKPAGAQD
jgi:poly(3-hydroxybutyrate) depolymerase